MCHSTNDTYLLHKENFAVLPFKSTVETATGNQILQITSSWVRISRDLVFNCTHSLKVWMKSASPEPEAPKEIHLMLRNTTNANNSHVSFGSLKHSLYIFLTNVKGSLFFLQ